MYCQYSEYYAVTFNLFSEETTIKEISASPESEIFIKSLEICHTYPFLPTPTPTPTPTPPTPTPTPTPTCEPLGGNSIVPCPTATPTPTPAPSPTVKITAVGFTGDRPIRRFEVSGQPYIDEPDGTTATWLTNDNPKFPVAYLKGTNLTLFAKFSITPSLTTSQSAQIRIKRGNNVITSSPVSVTLVGSEVRVNDITIPFSNLESGEFIRKSEYELTWQISFDNGSNWRNLDKESKHDIHWLNSNPANKADFKPFVDSRGNPYQGLFDKALEWSTGQVNKNEPDIQKVIQRINDKVSKQIIYKPQRSSILDNPLKILIRFPHRSYAIIV